MTDKEIRETLQSLSDAVFTKCKTYEDYIRINEQMDRFIEENNVSQDQIAVVIESGAGDILGQMSAMGNHPSK